MNGPCRTVLLAVAGTVALAIQQGCGRGSQTAQTRTDISWTSPRMLDIMQEWDSLRESRSQFKTKHDDAELQKALDGLLVERLSEQDARELAAACDTLPVAYEARSDFDNAVLTFVIKVLIESGNREELVTLLSKRCLNSVSPYECIEFYLVYDGREMKDPILVLGEAYSKSHVPQTRDILAIAIRRGFDGTGIRGRDDAEFVKNAMQWYEEEEGHLVVNERYTDNAGSCPPEAYNSRPKFIENFPGDREPLFVEKP